MCTHMRACACHSVYGYMVPPPLMPAMWESTMYRCAVCAQAPCKRPLTLRRDEGAEVRPFTSPQQHATTMPASPLPTLTCAYVPVAPCLGMYEHCYISAVPCRPEYPLHSVPHQHPAPGPSHQERPSETLTGRAPPLHSLPGHGAVPGFPPPRNLPSGKATPVLAQGTPLPAPCPPLRRQETRPR